MMMQRAFGLDAPTMPPLLLVQLSAFVDGLGSPCARVIHYIRAICLRRQCFGKFLSILVITINCLLVRHMDVCVLYGLLCTHLSISFVLFN